jgi:ABC-type hemin transport system ATPase subunit
VTAAKSETCAARCAGPGNRVALLDGGRLIAQGSPAEVLTPERLRAVYGVSVVVERLS